MFARSAALLALLIAATACDAGRQRPGGSSNTPRDAGFGSRDGGESNADAAEEGDAGGGRDAEPGQDLSIPDFGFPSGDAGFFDANSSDAGFPDAGFPSSDAGFPGSDAGFPSPRDAGFPGSDAGFPPPRDAGFPSFDAGGSGDAGFVQTQVSFEPGTALLNFAVTASGDREIQFSATLRYDNPGPSGEQVDVSSASLTVAALPVPVGSFTVGPGYFAPVGNTTHNVAALPGTTVAAGGLELLLCGGTFPLGVMLTFSNGATALESVTPTCN